MRALATVLTLLLACCAVSGEILYCRTSHSAYETLAAAVSIDVAAGRDDYRDCLVNPMTIAAAVMLFLAHGMPLAPASAAVAHGFVESRLDPAAVSRTGGVGLMQWHGTRRERLLSEAAAQRRDWRDPDLQADFIATELRERPEGVAFMSAAEPGQAALIFMQYERPANPRVVAGRRVALAREIYSQSIANRR